MPQFYTKVAQHLIANGRYFIVENPKGSNAWTTAIASCGTVDEWDCNCAPKESICKLPT